MAKLKNICPESYQGKKRVAEITELELVQINQARKENYKNFLEFIDVFEWLEASKYTFIFLFLFSVSLPVATSSPLQWKSYKSYKYDSKFLPQGKTVAKFLSPDKKYVLISRKEDKAVNSMKLYLHKDNQYTFIDDFQEINKVEWQPDSAKVIFHGVKQLNNEEISYWKVRYLPAKNLLLAMILKMNR